jgi:cell division transport system permease protein
MFGIIEGVKNIGRAKLSCILVSMLIGVALLVGGWFFHLTLQLKLTSDFAEQALEIEAFLRDGLPDDKIESLGHRFNSDPGITKTAFISKDSAAAIFQKSFGEDFLKLYDENPLPSSYRLNIKTELLTSQAMDSIVTAISGLPEVVDVIAKREYLLALLKYRKMIWITHISVGIIIFGFALILIFNVIKFSIYSRQKSIEIMKLVGATNRFIRRPFLVEGFLDGIFGGIFGSLMSYGTIKGFGYLFEINIFIPLYFYPVIVLTGGVIGNIGSFAAVRKFLKTV